MSNFIEECIDGKASVEDVDYYVAMWHESKSTKSLARYLGMDNVEYNAWLTDPNILPSIVKNHELLRLGIVEDSKC